MRRSSIKQNVFLIGGILISAWFLHKIFKSIDFKDLTQAMGTFNLLWLLPSLFFFYLSMYLRAVRWGFFFRPHFELTGRQLIRPLMICFAFNSIMPGRVGEFVRAFYIGGHEERGERVGAPMAMATILTERIFDGVTLLIFLAVSLAILPPIDPNMPPVEFWGQKIEAAMIAPLMDKIVAGCVVLVAGVGCFLIPGFPALLIRLIRAFPVLPTGAKATLAKIIEGVARGFDSVRGPRNLVSIIAYSFVLWGLIALSNQLLAHGFPGMQMNFIQASAIMSLVAVFILIPAAPGYWGLFEAGVIFGLNVLSIQGDDAVGAAYAIVLHLVQFVPIVVIGLGWALRDQVRIRKD